MTLERERPKTPNLEFNTYQPDLFVAQHHLPIFIESRIEEGFNKGSISPPTVFHIWGARGTGKSWLLEHIRDFGRALTEEKGHNNSVGTFSLYLDLAKHPQLKQYREDSKTSLLEDITGQLRDQNLLDGNETIKDFDKLAQLMAKLETRLVPIVLFDNVDQLSLTEDWFAIERNLIAPLAESEQAIVVVASNKEIVRWKKLSVRQQLYTQQLKPFTKQETLSQFQKYGWSDKLSNLAYSLTAGHPGANYLLGANLCRTNPEGNANVKAVQSLELVINNLMRGIPQCNRNLITTLSTLRRFNYESASPVLRSSDATAYNKPNLGVPEFRNLMNELSQTGFVWWDEKKLGYVVDPLLRNLIQEHDHLVNPIKSWQSHMSIFNYYDKKDPEGSYVLDAIYHLASAYRDEPAELREQRLLVYLDERLHYIGSYGKKTVDTKALEGVIAWIRIDPDITDSYDPSGIIPPDLYSKICAKINSLSD